MERPLKRLQLTSDGKLIVPTKADILRSCPDLPEDAIDETFNKLWQEFPRVEGALPAPNDPPPPPDPPPLVDLKVASHLDPELPEGWSVAKVIDLSPGSLPSLEVVKLTLLCKRIGTTTAFGVALKNTGDKTVHVPCGTFIGRGGLGAFVGETTRTLEDHEVGYSWLCSRLTDHKKDTPATKASGGLVFLEKGDIGPTIKTLQQLEKSIGTNYELYAHTITRGSTKVSVTPSQSTVHWVSDVSAFGDQDAFTCEQLGAWFRDLEKPSEDGNKNRGCWCHPCSIRV